MRVAGTESNGSESFSNAAMSSPSLVDEREDLLDNLRDDLRSGIGGVCSRKTSGVVETGDKAPDEDVSGSI